MTECSFSGELSLFPTIVNWKLQHIWYVVAKDCHSYAEDLPDSLFNANFCMHCGKQNGWIHTVNHRVTCNISEVMQIGFSKVKPSYYEQRKNKTKSIFRKNLEYSRWPPKSFSFRFSCHFLGLTKFNSSERINYSRDTFSRPDLMQ